MLLGLLRNKYFPGTNENRVGNIIETWTEVLKKIKFISMVSVRGLEQSEEVLRKV